MPRSATLTLALVAITLTFVQGRTISDLQSRMKRQADQNCYKADIVFVLDSSGSIGIDNWNKVLNFTQSIVSAFQVGPDNIRVGVNYYGNQATLAFHLNRFNNSQDVQDEIDEIPWKDQETNTSGGIRFMRSDMFQRQNGARGDAPAIGIVITDGESNRDQTLTIPEADQARQAGIILFAIGIGEAVSQDELNGIGNSPSQDYVFNADNFDALEAIRERVVVAACEAASECTENGDWAVILDSSGSVGSSNFALTKEFVKSMVVDSNLDTGEARIGLITFSSEATVQFYMDELSTRTEALDRIDAVPYTPGTTNTAAAFQLARREMFTSARGDRDGFRNVIIIFTDGGSDDFEETLTQAAEARVAGITVLVVAITNWVNAVEIREMASDPDDSNVFDVRNFNEINNIYTVLKRAICNDDNECSSNPCANGGVCVNLVNAYVCRCPTGFAGSNCQFACTSPADVALALDASTSMGREGYYKMQDFAKALARGLNLDPLGQDRMAMETFSTESQLRFNFNQFQNKADMMNAISFPNANGVTNTATGLNLMANQMFDETSGTRAGARRVGVLVSDGRSSDVTATFENSVLLHEAGISMMAVGVNVNGDAPRMELQGIASDPDQINYLEADSYDTLVDLADDVVQRICEDPDDCATNPCGNGATCVDRLNGYECLCPAGRTGIDCERQCDGEADVFFVVDSSGSIRANRFKVVLDFIESVTDNFEVRSGRIQVGLVTFANEAELQFGLDAYSRKEDIMHKMSMTPYSRGKTNIAAGLRTLTEQIENSARPNVPKLAIVVSDGQSTVDRENTIPEAILARIAGIHIVVAVVEAAPNTMEIMGIASKPALANIAFVPRFDDLSGLVQNVTDLVCNDADECASDPCQNGGVCTDRIRAYRCSCPDQWTGINCERSCDKTLDVTIILDASGSVDYSYEVAQTLAERIVWGLNFNNARTQVGVVTYQATAEVQFYMNAYRFKQEVIEAIAFDNNMRVKGTNTAEALTLMRTEMFSSVNGDRAGAENVAIVIGDGHSNINQIMTIPEANQAKIDGITLLSVGLGTDVNMFEVNSIASSPDSTNAFFLRSLDMLDEVADDILDRLCA